MTKEAELRTILVETSWFVLLAEASYIYAYCLFDESNTWVESPLIFLTLR